MSCPEMHTLLRCASPVVLWFVSCDAVSFLGRFGGAGLGWGGSNTLLRAGTVSGLNNMWIEHEQYPDLESLLDEMLPRKSPLIVAKCQNHINLVVVNNVPLFFNVRDGPYMPTLRLLHQYPGIMKKFRVDRGAIKFVLAGANIMCPGLTSAGGDLDEEVPLDSPVAIMAEGKEHALAIGYTKMSAKDMYGSVQRSQFGLGVVSCMVVRNCVAVLMAGRSRCWSCFESDGGGCNVVARASTRGLEWTTCIT
ncbi:hypothetical protein M758_UG218700 [Ceratodon purpureus]|nr:hypothetical protein M758_UG218700 [Ceratodon purpureus]